MLIYLYLTCNELTISHPNYFNLLFQIKNAYTRNVDIGILLAAGISKTKKKKKFITSNAEEIQKLISNNNIDLSSSKDETFKEIKELIKEVLESINQTSNIAEEIVHSSVIEKTEDSIDSKKEAAIPGITPLNTEAPAIEEGQWEEVVHKPKGKKNNKQNADLNRSAETSSVKNIQQPLVKEKAEANSPLSPQATAGISSLSSNDNQEDESYGLLKEKEYLERRIKELETKLAAQEKTTIVETEVEQYHTVQHVLASPAGPFGVFYKYLPPFTTYSKQKIVQEIIQAEQNIAQENSQAKQNKEPQQGSSNSASTKVFKRSIDHSKLEPESSQKNISFEFFKQNEIKAKIFSLFNLKYIDFLKDEEKEEYNFALNEIKKREEENIAKVKTFNISQVSEEPLGINFRPSYFPEIYAHLEPIKAAGIINDEPLFGVAGIAI